jgi:hypothetical protein
VKHNHGLIAVMAVLSILFISDPFRGPRWFVVLLFHPHLIKDGDLFHSLLKPNLDSSDPNGITSISPGLLRTAESYRANKEILNPESGWIGPSIKSFTILRPEEKLPLNSAFNTVSVQC